MSSPASLVPAALATVLLFTTGLKAQEPAPCQQPGCTPSTERFFVQEVWTKIGSQKCLTCHQAGGDAEKSGLVLQDPRKSQGAAQDQVLRHNLQAFARVALPAQGDEPKILLKVTGGLDHGGGEVLQPGSAGYHILAEFARRISSPPSDVPEIDLSNERSFFEGVVMVDDRQLLRRATLSLAGRLPTPAELEAVKRGGLQAMPALLDAVLQEEAFFDRIREAYNDIFLTEGYDEGAESALAYDHFSTTRLWYQKFDLSHVGDEDAQRKARYKLADDYRAALRGEPMRLVEHIVRNDRPFTEIVTADYIMVSPYTARGYGIYDEIKSRFKNPDDPFEYIPVKLKALKGRARSQDQHSPTGFYPHAGLLSMFQYLRRYPNTETNRNRLRARMFYQHFLGTDTLALAARVSDSAAVTAKFEIPTMQASECAVCHRVIDPVAGLFQDYYKPNGVFGPRPDGWYTDTFAPGFEGEDLPDDQKWRALQWLGERTASDPRFAATMVEHVYYVLTGRNVLLAPQDLDDPLYPARLRAYREQRRVIEQIAQQLTEENFNIKSAFKSWILSDFYRADGLATAVSDPARLQELDDVGVVRLLAPEQIERKVAAIFGKPWGKMDEQLAMLYGGINSSSVTERATEPSGAMGAIQRILANDVACEHTLRDFARPPSERILFPNIEPDVVPGTSAEGDAAIRRAIVHLHDRILGQYDEADSDDVNRTFTLFAHVVADAQAQGKYDQREAYNCRSSIENAPLDPHYTIRAWRAVVTYLLRRQEFLYE